MATESDKVTSMDEYFVVLTIKSPPEAADILSTLLFEYGCQGIKVDQSDRSWCALAYFSREKAFPSLEEILEGRINEFLQDVGVGGKVFISRGREQIRDWERLWRESLKPFRVGRRFVVRPSFCEFERRQGDIVITMDPRMAFGSGHHESTRLSLLSLERLVRPGNSLLDAGAGTGILAIAAAGLGAARILAVEIEHTAYENLLENLEVNGLRDRVSALLAPLEDTPADTFDIVAANLNKNALLSNMAGLVGKLRDGGRAVLSGFLREDSDELERQMRKCGLIPVTHEIMGEWVLFEGIAGTENTEFFT